MSVNTGSTAGLSVFTGGTAGATGSSLLTFVQAVVLALGVGWNRDETLWRIGCLRKDFREATSLVGVLEDRHQLVRDLEEIVMLLQKRGRHNIRGGCVVPKDTVANRDGLNVYVEIAGFDRLGEVRDLRLSMMVSMMSLVRSTVSRLA